MKNIIIVVAVFISSFAFSQNKNAKASLEVDGVCMMCKNRIEKACYSTKGVKSAYWDVKTHELKLIFDERKTNLKTIQNSVVAVGHDTKDLKAKDEIYKALDPCCLYRDKKVVDDHKH